MQPFIINTKPVSDSNTFVTFWKQFYDESYERKKYDQVVNKRSWEVSDIHQLFEWKNNMGEKLGRTKEIFVKKVVDNLSTANSLRVSYNHNTFIDTFGKLGPIWGITFLHAIQPMQFPIYDQHAHRAFSYISNSADDIIPRRNRVYTVYFNEYVPFFNKFLHSTNNFHPKDVDCALWAFGKFLSKYKKIIL